MPPNVSRYGHDAPIYNLNYYSIIIRGSDAQNAAGLYR